MLNTAIYHEQPVQILPLVEKTEPDRISLGGNASHHALTTPPDPVLTVKGGAPCDMELELQTLDKKFGEKNEDDGFSTAADGLLGGRKEGYEFRSINPMFPPLPSYDPPSMTSRIQCWAIRGLSFVLSLMFLTAVMVGALVQFVRSSLVTIVGGCDKTTRKYEAEERAREKERRKADQRWNHRQGKKDVDVEEELPNECPPLEGGKDRLVCDVGYYARRVGLDVETFKVQTEDGFIITLWHVYNPQEYTALSAEERRHRGPHVFSGQGRPKPFAQSNRRYPVLLVHGLLQSAGAFCTNDDDSLAFFLCKSGYDVWLGNNRCGMEPEHTSLLPSDPRMWSWDIRHLGAMDLAALISRVLYETGFEKLGLACHSQGTTETMIALAKDQRPELGERISVFCALAPAAYAGPLIERNYFRFVRRISPTIFRAVFGIHSFIPFMMTMQKLLHSRIYGALGYFVFSYLFSWTDTRWDRGLRDRMFQFAPVYVSSETMRWWLGQEGFAKHKCILATAETLLRQEEEDQRIAAGLVDTNLPRVDQDNLAWFGPQAPPFALWVGGSDELVDGRRLLRRFECGREPHVRVVHTKVIEEYEHLDVLWAMDAVEKVGKEVREMIWRTMPDDARAVCRVPRGVSE